MALLIPTFPDPRDPAAPLNHAYGWISALSLDLSGPGGGSVRLSVHPREEAWQAQPVNQIGVNLGQALGRAPAPGGQGFEEVRFPALAELMADPEFAAAFATIGAKLYQALTLHPALAGSSIT